MHLYRRVAVTSPFLTDALRSPHDGAGSAAAADLPRWSLDDLYSGADDPRIVADLDGCAADADAFAAAHEGKIGALLETADGAAALAGAIRAYEALQERLGRLYSFASLLYATDALDPAITKLHADVTGRINDISSRLIFFTLELNELPDEALAAALDASADLAYYAPWLRDLREEKPFQLSGDLERLLHEKHLTGAQAWNRLFDETLANLQVEIEGEKLDLEVALNRLSAPNAVSRQKAAEGLAATFADQAGLFTRITNVLAKDKAIEDRWRRHEDVADSRHLANRVEREVVDALVAAVSESYRDISHRYYRLKASWLGMDKLNYWDRNAPLPEDGDRQIAWSEAREIVLSAYRGFSPVMADTAKRFFDNGWIDAPPARGKAPGAFSHPTVPSAHPFVLLNYQGRLRDVMTLAHELGHGVHQVLAADKGLLLSQTPLTLAETASVFGEMLTFRSLLERAQSPAERRVMLASKVEDMINTVVRQIAFYQFERRVHEGRRSGELTAAELGEHWLAVQSASLGDGIRLNDGYEHYWCYIPHFIHAPFYVYAYAFGDCLVNSLYAVFEQSADGFAERYLEMLKAGGSKRHDELLAPFGLDARDPAFWRRGLSVISGLIDELESMEA